MVSRPVWKGQLRLSLVSIGVEIHSALSSRSKSRFRQIHAPSGERVHYQKVAKGVGPVESDDIMKGYETDKGEYVLIEPDEINAIKLETKHTLELAQFVGACEISPLWFDRPYYVVPSDELAEDAYRVVRDALRKSERIGLGQLTMRGKEYLCAIRPCGDGLLMETLRYEDEVREAEPLFADISDDAADDELLDVATQLIDRKTAPFDASVYEDHYETALRDLITRKTRSKKTPRAKPGEEEGPSGDDNVVDLMDALKKSLKSGGSTKPRKSGSRKPSGRKSA